MTEMGEGVSIGTGPGSDGDDLEDNHWLELEYLYQSGAPVYGNYRVTDGDGTLWTGRLNDQGKVCLAGLPAGTVEVDLLPETSTDDDIQATRQAIKRVLEQIIEDQKAEGAEYERDLENLGGPRRVYEHIHEFGASVWKQGVGVIEFLGTAAHKTIEVSNFLHPLNLLGDNLKAGYKSYQDGELNREQWYDSVNQNLGDEHKKDVARIFGIEPDDLSEERLKELMALITEAYDIAAFIADDAKTRDMLKQFVKELAETQHSMEWAGFAGAGVFELVLAVLLVMFTGGAGLAAQASTKLRHTAELRSLGPLFRKLAAQLRQKKLNKQVDVEVDQPTTTKTDQPDIIDLQARESDSGSGGVATKADKVQPAKVSPSKVDWNNSGPKGLSVKDPRDFAVGERMYESLVGKGLEPDLALTISRELLESGVDEPSIVQLKAGEKLYKVVPKNGGPPGGNSPYFMSREMLDRLPEDANKSGSVLGLPQVPDSFDIYEITAKNDVEVFQSEIAPFSVNGGNYTRSGGGTQTLVTDRSQFEPPRLFGD